jgi:cell wall-associated NlpC family hydrolase
VYERAGVAPHIEPPFYVPDWHLHQGAERYMEGLLQYAPPTDGPPLRGDIALFRFGRTFSHGAVVVEWPRLIHAYWSIGVVWGDATLYPLKGRDVRFFSPFGGDDA